MQTAVKAIDILEFILIPEPHPYFQSYTHYGRIFNSTVKTAQAMQLSLICCQQNAHDSHQSLYAIVLRSLRCILMLYFFIEPSIAYNGIITIPKGNNCFRLLPNLKLMLKFLKNARTLPRITHCRELYYAWFSTDSAFTAVSHSSKAADVPFSRKCCKRKLNTVRVSKMLSTPVLIIERIVYRLAFAATDSS